MRYLIQIILLSQFTFYSCQDAKKKGNELIETTQELLENQLNDLIESELDFHKTSFSNEFGKPKSFNLIEKQGLYFEMPFSFWYGFLKYEAEPQSVLNYISSLKTSEPEISDSMFLLTDTTIFFENIKSVKETYGEKLNHEFDFIEEVFLLDSIIVYECSRYPNKHQLIINQKTNLIYHHFEKYWD